MIEGSLVRLRAPEIGDLERNHRWMNDREVTRYLSARYELSLAAEEAWMRERVGVPLSWDNAFFAIETKEGRHIGNTNLFALAAEDRKAELGIMIGEKDCWSQGYGTDAVRTLVRFAFDEMNLNRVQLHAYAFNERAIAAYRKVGFIEEGRMRQFHYAEGAYHDAVVMGVLRGEAGG
jgi:RimJ/RimL family protein N-acetyltransferase